MHRLLYKLKRTAPLLLCTSVEKEAVLQVISIDFRVIHAANKRGGYSWYYEVCVLFKILVWSKCQGNAWKKIQSFLFAYFNHNRYFHRLKMLYIYIFIKINILILFAHASNGLLIHSWRNGELNLKQSWRAKVSSAKGEILIDKQALIYIFMYQLLRCYVLISGIEPPKCLHINTPWLGLDQCVNIFLFMHKMTLHRCVSFSF